MARILAIDYGGKRCGIAVTDESKIIASGLTTVDTKELLNWLKAYVAKKKRRDKALVDQISATIILQDYLYNL